MTFIYVLPLSEENDGYGFLANGGIPPSQQLQQQQHGQQGQQNNGNNGNESSPGNEPPKKQNVCTRFLTSCKDKMQCTCCKKKPKPETVPEKVIEEIESTVKSNTGCFSCMKKRDQPVKINIEEPVSDKKPSIWSRMKCCGKSKVHDSNCFPCGKRKNNWAERKDSIIAEAIPVASKRSKCSKACLIQTLGAIFCFNLCRKKKPLEDPASRRASMISKKKSLTPTSLPPEEAKPQLDMSLVEHNSHMRGAIPVLPVCLAWFCLILNVLIPGLGTIFSGMFCLCMGIPRFSQKDGPRQRIGAFIIDLVIGIGQCFTVLFCLVGWGWSIWWGVTMVKIARKYRKIKILEAHSQEENARAAQAAIKTKNHGKKRDVERGS